MPGMAKGDLQSVVGENLRAYRRARGINQEDFADRLGLHRTYLGDIERGERNLSLQKVELFAELLD
jgi:transcriptional regulator with XRE-family HTH domain